MDSSRWVLVTIKIIQLAMGIGCLTLRESAHMNPDMPEVHNTLFCGTFMGFTLIAVALLLGYCIRRPAPKEVDLFFGFVGGVCFYVCGLLSMHYPMIDEKVMLLPPEETANYPFFALCSDIAMMCFVNALLYIFEACMLYDLWYYDLQQEKRLHARDAERPKESRPPAKDSSPTLEEVVEEEEEEEVVQGQLGRLRLRCYCLDIVWAKIAAAVRRRRAATTAAQDKAGEAGSSRQSSPQAGPSHAVDMQPSSMPRRQSFGGFERRRASVASLPVREEDEDSDSKD